MVVKEERMLSFFIYPSEAYTGSRRDAGSNTQVWVKDGIMRADVVGCCEATSESWGATRLQQRGTTDGSRVQRMLPC